MSKRMLVVIDYQNDFVDGALGFPGAETLDAGIAERVGEYLATGDLVAVTMDTHDSRYLETREGKQLPVPHCIEGTVGWQLYGETGALLRASNYVELRKNTFGINAQTLACLPEDIEEIECVGLVANMCVLSNVCVLQTRYKDAQITVDAALCGSYDPVLHQKALDILTGLQVIVKE